MAKPSQEYPYFQTQVSKQEDIVLRWTEKAKSNIALELAKLGLEDRGKLINSISGKVRKRYGDIEAVTFRYLYYGFFHHSGAINAFGKGVDLPALNWQANAINPLMEGLATDLAEHYAEVAIKNIDFKSK